VKISSEEYFFIEWLIIARGMTEESYNKLTINEIVALKAEYARIMRN